jgi:hypothetical protein
LKRLINSPLSSPLWNRVRKDIKLKDLNLESAKPMRCLTCHRYLVKNLLNNELYCYEELEWLSEPDIKLIDLLFEYGKVDLNPEAEDEIKTRLGI